MLMGESIAGHVVEVMSEENDNVAPVELLHIVDEFTMGHWASSLDQSLSINFGSKETADSKVEIPIQNDFRSVVNKSSNLMGKQKSFKVYALGGSAMKMSSA